MHPKYKEDRAIIAPLIASRLHRNVSNYPLFGSGAITYVFYQHKFSKKMKKSSLCFCFLFYIGLPIAAYSQCTGGWDVTYNNSTLTTATAYTNKKIRIIGTVNFNANVTLTQCVVDMDPGATLNIGNNSTFGVYDNPSTVTPTFIQACNAMWNAINILPGSTIIGRGSHISGGRTALVFHNGFNNASS